MATLSTGGHGGDQQKTRKTLQHLGDGEPLRARLERRTDYTGIYGIGAVSGVSKVILTMPA